MRKLLLCLILLLSFQSYCQISVRQKMEMINSIINNKDSTVHKSSDEKLKLIHALISTKDGTLDPRYPNVHVDPSLEKINQIQNKSDSTSTLTSDEKIQQIQQVYDEYGHINPTFSEKMVVRRNYINKNAFKIDAFRALVYGEASIFYERSLTKRFSFELGVGLTYKLPLQNPLKMLAPVTFNSIRESTRMGYVSYLGLRFYLQKTRKGLSGFYIGPSFRYRHNNSRYDGVYKGFDDIGSFTVDAGYQLWFAKHTGLNFYVGPGISYSKEKSYYKTPIYNGQMYEANFNYYSIYTTSFSFYINAGVKIDLGW